MAKFENFIKSQIVPTLPQVLPSWGKQSDNTGEKVMSKSKHTPGPRGCVQRSHGTMLVRSEASGVNGYSAEIYLSRPSEREANAHLIAAAAEVRDAPMELADCERKHSER